MSAKVPFKCFFNKCTPLLQHLEETRKRLSRYPLFPRMFMTEETLIEYLIKIVSSRSVIKDVFWDITGSLDITGSTPASTYFY